MGMFQCMALLGDGTAVICCNGKMKRYSLETGAELSCIDSEIINELAEVEINGKMAIAGPTGLLEFGQRKCVQL